jgi:hypothetical protein
MNITFPTDTYETIDAIRGAIGRDVEFYVPSLSGCSICDLDPVTNTSTDSFCDVCSGNYWIKTYSIITLSGHITWGPADVLQWHPGGQLFDGDCRVQIKYTEVNKETSEDADYIVVDDKQLEIKRSTLRGVPSINRILLDCIEKDRDNE